MNARPVKGSSSVFSIPLQDLDRDVGRIDAIQSKALDTIKDWLTSVDIKYYESKVNLNWKNILKSIKEVRGNECVME